jgi:hypothetical protein
VKSNWTKVKKKAVYGTTKSGMEEVYGRCLFVENVNDRNSPATLHKVGICKSIRIAII